MKLISAVNERLDEKRRIVAYLDSFSLKRDLRQAGLALSRELQSASGVVVEQPPMCHAEFIEALFEGRIETTVRAGCGV